MSLLHKRLVVMEKNINFGLAVFVSIVLLAHCVDQESCRVRSLRNRLEAIKLLEEDATCPGENSASEFLRIQETLAMVKENTESILEQINRAATVPAKELIFRVRSGIGGSVSDGYVSGRGTDSSYECFTKYIRCMYRSGVIDNWQNEKIKKVRYSIKKGDTEVAFIEFFARGTTSTNWFSAGNVMNSTWTDLRGNTFKYFSIVGDANLLRRFFIHKTYGGCSIDAGWTVILDGYGACKWGKHSSYPTILYAKSSGLTNFESIGVVDGLTKVRVSHVCWNEGLDVADEMELYVYRN